MKKILTTVILIISIFSVSAQNINFTNLYGNNASEPDQYHISNTQTGFGGDWGLDIKWWGGVKLRSSLGILYLNKWGNLGIGTETPTEKLDVNGNVRINSNTQYTFLTLGQQPNDQIIVDNTSQKYFGGGYFFRVHNDALTNQYVDALMIDENGNVGIGINPPQNKLDVAGKSSFSDNMKVNAKIEAKEVKVTQSPTADFVFEENYDLPNLEDVEKHIKEKKHLPEIASAKEMEKDGVNVGEFQIKLLQKIEELTLYTIEQNKKIKQLEQENQQIKSLLERVERLEKKKN